MKRMMFTKDGTTVEMEQCYETRTTCRACGDPHLETVLDLGEQYLPRFVKDIDLSLPMAPLELVRCSCGLLQLRHTVKPDLVFREYWYQSSINQTMKDALANVVKDGVRHHRNGKWVDIGANDGYLLSQVPQSFQRVACEPALNLADKAKKHADLVVSNYFSAEWQAFHGADVITSCAMFYDLDDPKKFVRDIAKCLAPDGVWINQLNDSPTMLDKSDFSAICHEHLTYWDIMSLDRLYTTCGLTIVDVSHNDVNGGSMRVTAMKHGTHADLIGARWVNHSEAMKFGKRAAKWKKNMNQLLDSITSPVWLYGASTKGCVMLQYLDHNQSFVGIADRNPAKFGLHMSGCWIPVVDEATMRREKPEYVFVLPYAFRKEFDDRETALRESGTTLVYPFPDISLVL